MAETCRGGGARVTVRVELFGVSVGRVGVGRYLILSRLSDPKGSADSRCFHILTPSEDINFGLTTLHFAINIGGQKS